MSGTVQEGGTILRLYAPKGTASKETKQEMDRTKRKSTKPTITVGIINTLFLTVGRTN